MTAQLFILYWIYYTLKKKTVLKTFKFSAATTTVFFIEIKCYNGEKKDVTLRLEHGEIWVFVVSVLILHLFKCMCLHSAPSRQYERQGNQVETLIFAPFIHCVWIVYP